MGSPGPCCVWPLGTEGVLVCPVMPVSRDFVPQPRRRGVVSQEVDGETLLYVEETHQASSLNGPASRIWALCDGARPAQAIADEADLRTDVVLNALKQFADAGLLENGAELQKVNVARRLLVGAALAGPVVLMVMAPRAAAAASCIQSGNTCQQFIDTCCSTGPCTTGFCQ